MPHVASSAADLLGHVSGALHLEHDRVVIDNTTIFYVMLGMEISQREGQSVYLRAYEDFYQYTLKITERDQPGLEEITWRARAPEALERIVATLQESERERAQAE
jgi:catechol 2,3-dioxygenase